MKGSLMQRIREVSAAALQSGALLPIPTDCEYIEDAGIRFIVRVVSSLRRKDEEKKRQKEVLPGRRVNPFLPPDAELYIGEVTETHSAVLNKFNVIDRHLLIVTKEFESQEMLLTEDDFAALLICMEEYDGLGFYNGGAQAGASQPHKHLQLVPLPLSDSGPRVPIEPLFRDARFNAGVGVLPAFPFVHAFAFFNSRGTAVRTVFGTYQALLEGTGLRPPQAGKPREQSGPYCLLMTKEWMLLVPRSREFFEGISINSLGFAGSLFVRDANELALIRRAGPLAVLRSVALP
ncbi:MAG: ATP adenylyltransferase [Thermodesulfovibrionales bacterium]